MDFFRAQFTKIPRVQPTDLADQTVLITGANTGIGFEAAKEVLRSKPKHLILACRDVDKGHEARKLLEHAVNDGSSTQIEVRKLDQSSFDSVKTFARDLQGRQVNIAILNAGVFNTKWTTTCDGYEGDLQVNALSSALLSLMLLPNLRLAHEASAKQTPSRLSIVSSGLHEMAKFKESKQPQGQIINALNDHNGYNQQDRYPATKTMGLLWTKELAARIPREQVIINAPNPGFCRTGLMNNTTGFMRIVVQIFAQLFGRSAPDGARCIVDAAIGKGQSSHGTYLTEMCVKPEKALAPKVRDTELQRRVWDEVVEHLRKANAPFETP